MINVEMLVLLIVVFGLVAGLKEYLSSIDRQKGADSILEEELARVPVPYNRRKDD